MTKIVTQEELEKREKELEQKEFELNKKETKKSKVDLSDWRYVLVLIFGFLVLWLTIIPALNKSNCKSSAEASAQRKGELAGYQPGHRLQTDVNYYYEICMK